MTDTKSMKATESGELQRHPDREAVLRPAVDIYEDSTGITLKADLPGVSRDRLDVQVICGNGATVPVLEQAGQNFPKNSARILERKMYWATVQRVLENSARDPVTANRQLRMMTGHDLPEIALNFRDTLANYGRAVGK